LKNIILLKIYEYGYIKKMEYCNMILSKEDATLFFKLMFPLQIYINRKMNIVPEVKSVQDFLDESMEIKQKIRNALYENPGLIDQYISENPDNLQKENLEIIIKWKIFRKGKFFIERYLKEYAVFIEDEKVFAVLGLRDHFEKFFHKTHLPVYLETVLLPFKRKIIYDGMFMPYSIHFGNNTKSELKEIYLRAKQHDEIITSFDQKKEQAEPKPVIAYDFKPDLDELLKKIQVMEKTKGQPVIFGPALKLIKASLQLAITCNDEHEDPEILLDEVSKVVRVIKNINKIINRM
jgi:hypothetical protein